MQLQQIIIKNDFFQMLKILTPDCRHEVLDALLVYAFGNGHVPMRPTAKAVFDIIRRDMDSQVEPPCRLTEDMLTDTAEITQVTLPTDVCYSEMPFPQLWEKLPYETTPVIRPDYIVCTGDETVCPYKMGLESIPNLPETVKDVNRTCNPVIHQTSVFHRYEVPVVRKVPSKAGDNQSETVIQSIDLKNGTWREVMERFIKTSGSQTGMYHPLRQIPFMRDIMDEKPTCLSKCKSTVRKHKETSLTKDCAHSFSSKVTHWTRRFSPKMRLEIMSDDARNVPPVQTNECVDCTKCYHDSERSSTVTSCCADSTTDVLPKLTFWPVLDEQPENGSKIELNSSIEQGIPSQSNMSSEIEINPIVVSYETPFNPFPRAGNYARGVPNGTH